MTRTEQLAYSEIMDRMLQEDERRLKARKLIAVLLHALGRENLRGLTVLDVGCSAGFIADELRRSGARTIGVDIDEPGLARANMRFGRKIGFCLARGEALPFPTGSIDVVVLNHIYEHVLDPHAVLADIHRVLSPAGVVYLGIGHRWQLIEPHHGLPLLSWLPQRVADRYLRLARKGDRYHERYYTPRGLRHWVSDFDAWDYTLAVIAEPQRFAGLDAVPPWAARIPTPLLRMALPLVPTYLWVGFKTPSHPSGPKLRTRPRRLRGTLVSQRNHS